MTAEKLNVLIPVRMELLARFEGSEDLHLLGTVTQEFPVTFIPPSADAPVTVRFGPGVTRHDE